VPSLTDAAHGKNVVSMKKKRGCLIAAVVGGLVLGCLLLLLAACRERYPHISHQEPYRWDQYPRPNLTVENEPFVEVVAKINAVFAETSNGELTEAIKIDTTPTRIVRVNCSAELDPYADVFIAAYREHEVDMNRRGACGFENTLISGEVLQEGHSIGCTLAMPSSLYYETREDALVFGRSPHLMECRPYVVTDGLVERMKDLQHEGSRKVDAEAIVSALIYETGIDSWTIMMPKGPNSWTSEFRCDAVFRYLAEPGVILTLAIPKEHAEAERRLKASGLWVDPVSETPLKELSRERLSEASRRDIELAAGREDEEGAEEGRRTAEQTLPAGSITLDLGEGVTIELVPIPAGEFMTGSPDSDPHRIHDWETQHRVRITRPFWMGRCEVSGAQYERVIGRNPSRTRMANKPVERVSWEDATEFCRRLSERSGRKVRLPTEAEWEYACRAGSTTRYFFGDDGNEFGEYAWYHDNSGDKTRAVGRKRANAWGLHDMYGNVWEWCSDWYDEHYYAKSPSEDPTGPTSGRERVMRGGGYYCSPGVWCRSAVRGREHPLSRHAYLGFRVVAEAADR